MISVPREYNDMSAYNDISAFNHVSAQGIESHLGMRPFWQPQQQGR